MNRIALTALILLPLPVLSQKLKKPEIDKISGDTTFRTTADRLNTKTTHLGSDILIVSASKIKGAIILSVDLFKGLPPKVFSIRQGDNLILKLKNNKVVTLKAIGYSLTDNKIEAIGDIVPTSVESFSSYVVDSAGIQDLLSSELISVRISSSNGYFDYDIKNRESNSVRNMITLLAAK